MRLPGAARLLSLGLLPAALLAADYHVDSQTGNDAREGLTPDTAWRTLERVNAATFKPGDRVFFRAGSVWPGQLRVTAQGEPGRPIIFRASARLTTPWSSAMRSMSRCATSNSPTAAKVIGRVAA
jgi:hypothetical protein